LLQPELPAAGHFSGLFFIVKEFCSRKVCEKGYNTASIESDN